ncbi:inverted formin-2-like [Phoenix dactylifera]|uniref:Small ribosomal subunit protein uS15c n=1 Tax=Phoenix dactylifera TaxID=42345 RepID=A0A8B8ZQF4_PHODC|nr:inverted formin-2-like [Phoenix dactylifera]XP_038976500.1 inverted formin-2-like [Phoenix dactylifera]
MALHLRLRPKTLAPLPSLGRFSSSSSSPPPPPPPADSDSNGGGGGGGDNEDSPPPTSPPYSSLFGDIKERLKSPPAPPRRIPTDPPPPPPLSSPKPGPAASLEEIRKHLAGFRLRSGGGPPPPSGERPPSSPPTISFQELFKNNVLNKTDGGGAGEWGPSEKGARVSFDSIRESLRQFRASPRDQTGPRGFDFKAFQDSLRSPAGEAEKGPSLIGGRETLPESIFGKELREKKGEGDRESKALKTEFVKMYSYDELGEKLRKLRPEEATKGDKDWFSLSELNERLAKLRELEEKETESRMGGVSFRDLRESLVRLKEADATKKANMQRLSTLINLGGQVTPTFKLKPPQEHLLERYFHPDHMSSAEKLKLELKRVRDEFKLSESDCGSARVQVAQLTTKIKHLSAVLHKKDKHSRKGLQEMVQRRKKYLKYLRRTDWDSYRMVLSRLGLRDVPEYKAPEYKS